LSNLHIEKTLVIGLGLIGGSFAKTLKQNKISAEIFGCDLDLETLDLAQDEGVIDGVISLEENIAQFNLIVIATPLSAYEKIFRKLQNKISTDAIIIDLGSVKNFKIKNLPQNFIPCHPIAGSENTGFEHALADLFLGKKFIICSQHSQRNKVAEIATKIGAEVEFMDAKSHDEIFALVSHLPQFLSFLTAEFSPKNIEDEFFKKAFRLDNSSPEIWEDIFKMNEGNLEKFYLEFFDNLEESVMQLSVPMQVRVGVSDPDPMFASKVTEGQSPNLGFDANMWTGSEDPVQRKIQQNFFQENFPAIFFRALVAQSCLKIPQIKTYAKHAGQGFHDFTSIIEVLNCDQQILTDLVKKNHKEILKIFNSIS
jgi:prephenate dehydrogenase